MTSEEIIEMFEEIIKAHERREVFSCSRDKYIEAMQTAITMLKAQPCEDAISRIAALDALRTNWANWAEYDDGYLAMKLTMDDLKKMPAVPKQRTGKWIPTQHFDEWYCPTGVCSNCGIEYIYGLPFCPACGAKMEGESE